MKHFFIIGAQRSGTTYLYNCLNAHSRIKMATPVRPEPKYFLREGDFNYSSYLSDCFPWEADGILLGEKGTSYIEYPRVCEKIRSYFPEALFIIVLRDPVKRAISNAIFSINNGVEDRTISDIFQGLNDKSDWDSTRFSVNPFSYLERGKYVKYLDELSNRIPLDRIAIVKFEDLIGDPGGITALLNKLGLDFEPLCWSNEPVNASKKDEQVEDEIHRRLAAYFRPYNDALRMRYGVDINDWL